MILILHTIITQEKLKLKTTLLVILIHLFFTILLMLIFPIQLVIRKALKLITIQDGFQDLESMKIISLLLKLIALVLKLLKVFAISMDLNIFYFQQMILIKIMLVKVLLLLILINHLFLHLTITIKEVVLNKMVVVVTLHLIKIKHPILLILKFVHTIIFLIIAHHFLQIQIVK